MTWNKQSILALSTFFAFVLSVTAIKAQKKESSFEDQLERVSDSIKVGNIVIHNLFKSQILAHKNGTFDSLLIVRKVYEPHKKLWDNCYGMIFGPENGNKFNNPHGMIEWNRTLYPKNKPFFDDRAKQLLAINLNTTLKNNLTRFNSLTGYKPSAKMSILFTPLLGITFGGCSSEQFCLELNSKTDVAYIIEKGIPHEFNHLAYEPFRDKDKNGKTALSQTIDEGLACYFTWVFFKGKMPKYEAVENMSFDNWNWFLKNEKDIFLKTKAHFYDTSGNNPLLRNDKQKLFPDAPKTLNYWLGFRIVESYVKKYGKNSWKDIYKLPVEEVYEKSGYEKYVLAL